MAIADLLQAEAPPLSLEPNGAIRVGVTRVGLEIVLNAYNAGETPEQIVASFDTLDLGDVYSVIAHYHHHREEIDEYLRQRESDADAIAQQWENRSYSQGLREQLSARVNGNASSE